MSNSVLVGWSLLFAPLIIKQFIKDKDIRMFFSVVCTAMALGVFIGHFIDLISK